MSALTRLSHTLGLEEAELRRVLAPSADGENTIWYVRAVIGIGAWITAFLIGGFALVILSFFDIDFFKSQVELGVMGALAYGGAVVWSREYSGGDFSSHFVDALMVAGAALIGTAVGIGAENLWAISLTAGILAVATVAWRASRIVQTLMSLSAIAIFVMTLMIEDVVYANAVLSGGLVLGSVLLLLPPRIDVRPTAILLMMAAPLMSAAMTMLNSEWSLQGISASGSVEWLSRGIHMAAFIALAAILWRRLPGRDNHVVLAAVAVAATLIVAIMAPGGSAALVILMMAFVLGSRGLALAGVCLEIYFLVFFYYDLGLSLLAKSVMLTIVGAVLTGLWVLLARSAFKPARTDAPS